MKLSVIIPCRNAVKTIEVQLRALCHQQWHGGWEVIVADNGSTDGTQDVVAGFYGRLPALRLVDASARRGAAHARNIAVKESSGEALAFCDADDEVGIGWLTAMGNALTRHDFVASRMDVDKLNPPWLAVSLNNVQGKELRRAYYPPFLLHAGSSGMGVKRVVHDKVGGFDESLREREDTDYCFRIQLKGNMLHFAADATIHIRYSEKPEALFRQARRWARYQVLLYKRHGGGMPLDRPWSSYLQTWRDLIGCMPRVFKPETRPAWMKTVGTQIGLLEGAIRYRVAPVCAMNRSESASEAGALPMPPLLEQFFEPQLRWTSTGVNLPNQDTRQELRAENMPTEVKESGTRGQKLLMFFICLGSNVGAFPTLL
jgi:glycosyltransferase involved in cell wall biosynthesis